MKPSAFYLSSKSPLVSKRVKGIEPSSLAWKAIALPLSYTRALVHRHRALRRINYRDTRRYIAARFDAVPLLMPSALNAQGVDILDEPRSLQASFHFVLCL